MSTAGTASDARFVHFKDELHRVVVDVVDLSRIDRWSVPPINAKSRTQVELAIPSGRRYLYRSPPSREVDF